MHMTSKVIIAAALLLSVAGCGDKKQATACSAVSPEDQTAAELARFQAEENARSRVTLIDAAMADAAAMPPEYSGPSAYDLEAKGEEKKMVGRAPEKPDGPSEAAPEPANTTHESFPSVAE